ncbi:MAG TPA: hypothetical protein VEX13_02870, partial [Chloroflexia bacterium]|nr:hypothetical protein [Chloroflexia bacterium]
MAITSPIGNAEFSAWTPNASEIAPRLELYRRRIRQTRRRRYLAMSALGMGTLWVVAALLSYLDLAPAALTSALLGISLLFPVAALALEALRRPSLPQTAAILDSALDNKQRIVTSIELLSTQHSAPSTQNSIAGAQLASTADILARNDPRTLYPARTPWGHFALGAGLLLLALSLFVFKGIDGAFGAMQLGSTPGNEQSAAAISSPTAQSGLPESENTPQPEEAPQPEPGAGGEEGSVVESDSGPLDPEEAARRVENSHQVQEALGKLGEALNEQSVTQQAADSLKQGNYDDAAEQLEKLAQENDQLSEAAKEGLADSLEKAAQASDSAPDLQQAERRAADALRNGDYGEVDAALRDLAKKVRETGENVIPQSELAEGFPEPAQGGDIGSEDQGSDQSQGGEQDQAGDGQGQNGEQGDPNQAGADNPNEHEGSGGSGDGKGSRVSDPQANKPLNVEGNPFELDVQPDPGQSRPGADNAERPALTLEGSSGTSAAAPATQGGEVTTPGENNSLP